MKLEKKKKKKPTFHPSCSGSPTLVFLLVRHKRLSCRSCDLCWYRCAVFPPGLIQEQPSVTLYLCHLFESIDVMLHHVGVSRAHVAFREARNGELQPAMCNSARCTAAWRGDASAASIVLGLCHIEGHCCFVAIWHMVRLHWFIAVVECRKRALRQNDATKKNNSEMSL